MLLLSLERSVHTSQSPVAPTPQEKSRQRLEVNRQHTSPQPTSHPINCYFYYYPGAMEAILSLLSHHLFGPPCTLSPSGSRDCCSLDGKVFVGQWTTSGSRRARQGFCVDKPMAWMVEDEWSVQVSCIAPLHTCYSTQIYTHFCDYSQVTKQTKTTLNLACGVEQKKQTDAINIMNCWLVYRRLCWCIVPSFFLPFKAYPSILN